MVARSSVDSTRTNDPPPRRQLVRVVATSSLPPRRIRSGESKTGWLSGTRPKSCSPVHSWRPVSHTALAAAGRAATRSSGAARTSALSMAPDTRVSHAVARGARLHWMRTSGELTGPMSGPMTSIAASYCPVRSTRSPAHHEASNHTQLVQWPGRAPHTERRETPPGSTPSLSSRYTDFVTHVNKVRADSSPRSAPWYHVSRGNAPAF